MYWRAKAGKRIATSRPSRVARLLAETARHSTLASFGLLIDTSQYQIPGVLRSKLSSVPRQLKQRELPLGA